MEPYVLFPLASRSSAEEGSDFHTLRRTRWTFTLRVLSLESGGSVALQLESHPGVGDDDYTTLHDFGTLSSVADTTVRTFAVGSDAADFAMTEKDLQIRGNITANTGNYILELLGESRFWDPDVDAHREDLTPVLEASPVELARYMSRAERDVLRFLQEGIDGNTGALNVDSSDHDAKDIIRLAVVEQADCIQQRELLGGSKDDSSRWRTMSKRGLCYPAEEQLEDILLSGGRVWRGR